MHAAIAVRDTELPQGLGNLLQDGTVIVIRQAMNDGPNSIGDISSRPGLFMNPPSGRKFMGWSRV